MLSCLGQELRPPIAALSRVAVELTEGFDSLTDAQMREKLAAVHYGALALSGLVDNVLTLMRIQTGRFQPHQQPFRLLDVLMAILPAAELLLRQKAQQVRLQARPGLPDVLADRQQIGQVLTILIGNAGEVTARGAPIAVSLAQHGPSVRVTVADRGPWVLGGQGAHRFERRPGPEATDVTALVGAGLGFAVIEAILDAHGGAMGADNRRGRGAAFWVDLPTRDDQSAGTHGSGGVLH